MSLKIKIMADTITSLLKDLNITLTSSAPIGDQETCPCCKGKKVRTFKATKATQKCFICYGSGIVASEVAEKFKSDFIKKLKELEND